MVKCGCYHERRDIEVLALISRKLSGKQLVDATNK
jgi:hypothetical protein